MLDLKECLTALITKLNKCNWLADLRQPPEMGFGVLVLLISEAMHNLGGHQEVKITRVQWHYRRAGLDNICTQCPPSSEVGFHIKNHLVKIKLNGKT